MARNLDKSSIPENWKYDFLDKFAIRCSGHTPSQSHPEYWNGGIKWISLADSNRLDQGYIFETTKQISDEGIKNSSAVLLPAETVILSRDAGIGKSAVMSETMAVSQHFMAWKCDNHEKLHSWFLYNWLQLNKPEFERQAVGSTIKTIGLPYFKKLKIAVPPFPEQQKIAQILSTWDKGIAVTEQLLANSQQQKKALMQQLLTGKKRLLEENGVRFEGEWRKQRLGSLLKEGKERNKDNSISRVLSVTNHSGFVLPENQFSKRIASDEVSHYKVVRKGQYGYNPSRINVGSFARLDQFSEGLLSPMYIVFSIDSVELDSDFFLYWMQSNEAQQRINNSTQGSVRDSVGFDAICSFLFKMPSLEEQKKISAVISASLQEIKLLETKLDYLQQEKKALMQQLLTGKRRVKIAV